MLLQDELLDIYTEYAQLAELEEQLEESVNEANLQQLQEIKIKMAKLDIKIAEIHANIKKETQRDGFFSPASPKTPMVLSRDQSEEPINVFSFNSNYGAE